MSTKQRDEEDDDGVEGVDSFVKTTSKITTTDRKENKTLKMKNNYKDKRREELDWGNREDIVESRLKKSSSVETNTRSRARVWHKAEQEKNDDIMTKELRCHQLCLHFFNRCSIIQ